MEAGLGFEALAIGAPSPTPPLPSEERRAERGRVTARGGCGGPTSQLPRRREPPSSSSRGRAPHRSPGAGRGGRRAGGGACRDGPYEGSAGRRLPPGRPLTRWRSEAQHGSAMAAAAEEAAESGGGSPSSARRRLRIISGHLRGSPRAPEREALSLSPCKAQGGSAGPASGSIPKKRWVRAGVPAGQRAPGRAGGGPRHPGRAPGAAGCRCG